MRPVEPLCGAASYVGGKRNPAARIVKRIEAIPHLCYVEPSVGMATCSSAPIRADNRGGERSLARRGNVLSHPPAPLPGVSRYDALATHHAPEFQRLCATEPDTSTDLERSARFYYLQRIGFRCKVVCGTADLRSRRRPLRPSISRVWARSSRSCICVWPESRSRTWTMPGFAAPWLSADDTLLLRSAILRLGEGLRHRAVHAGRVRQPGRPAERSPVLVHPRRQRLTSDARLLRRLHPSSRYRRPTQSAATTSPNAYKSCW